MTHHYHYPHSRTNHRSLSRDNTNAIYYPMNNLYQDNRDKYYHNRDYNNRDRSRDYNNRDRNRYYNSRDRSRDYNSRDRSRNYNNRDRNRYYNSRDRSRDYNSRDRNRDYNNRNRNGATRFYDYDYYTGDYFPKIRREIFDPAQNERYTRDKSRKNSYFVEKDGKYVCEIDFPKELVDGVKIIEKDNMINITASKRISDDPSDDDQNNHRHKRYHTQSISNLLHLPKYCVKDSAIAKYNNNGKLVIIMDKMTSTDNIAPEKSAKILPQELAKEPIVSSGTRIKARTQEDIKDFKEGKKELKDLKEHKKELNDLKEHKKELKDLKEHKQEVKQLKELKEVKEIKNTTKNFKNEKTKDPLVDKEVNDDDNNNNSNNDNT
jgi:hypothetical protein